MAIERGPWRDTDRRISLRFPMPGRAALPRTGIDLFLRPSQTSVTFRNNASQTALPVRDWGAFMLGNGVGGAGVALERGDLALPAERFRLAQSPDATLWRQFSPRGYDHPGLGVTFDDLEPHYELNSSICAARRAKPAISRDFRTAATPSRARARALIRRPRGASSAICCSRRRPPGLGYKPSPNPPAICRRPIPIRSASHSGSAACFSSAIVRLADSSRPARGPRSCRCSCGSRISKRARIVKSPVSISTGREMATGVTYVDHRARI